MWPLRALAQGLPDTGAEVVRSKGNLMTEIEQLREEIARLRERVAVLEAQPTPPAMPLYIGPAIAEPARPMPPSWAPTTARDPWSPPFTVTCDGSVALGLGPTTQPTPLAKKKHDGPCWRQSHADCGC